MSGRPTAAELVAAVDALCERLAELHYVDAMLEHLDGCRRTVPLVPSVLEIAVTVGWTHPVRRTIHEFGESQAEIEATQERLRAAGHAWAADLRAQLRAQIAPFVLAREEHFVAAYRQVVAAYETLEALHEDAAGLDHSLGDWQGLAAEQFATGFYTPLTQVRNNQAFVLDVVRSALVAAHAVDGAARRELLGTLEAATKLADDLLRARQPDGRRGLSYDVLIAGEVVAGLISAVKFASPPTAATFAGAAAALGYVANRTDERQARTRRLEASSAPGVAEAVGAAVTGLGRRVTAELGRAETALVQATAFVAFVDGGGRWWPPRPWLADGVNSGDFFHASSGRG